MGKGKKTELAKMARIGKTRMKFLVCAWREKIEGDKNREKRVVHSINGWQKGT